jgi:muconolactone delta-isomerase
MAQFIALCTRNVTQFRDEDFAPLLGPEAERARELYAAGSVRAAWGRKDVPGAVLLIEAESREAAQAAVLSLPLAERGMLEVTLVPVGPYRGFCPPA